MIGFNAKRAGVIPASLLTLMLGGCIFDGLGDLNPFAQKETILPGERRSVLPRATDETTGGTASIGSATLLSDWSQPGGTAANAPGHISLSGGSGATVWRAKAISPAGKKDARSSSPPIVHGGSVYVYDAGGAVSALTSGGGAQWTVSVKPEGEKTRATGGGIAASGGTVFAATGFGELVALDAGGGKRLWTYKLDAPARSAPTVADGKVYVVSSTSTVHAVNAADGTLAFTAPGLSETAGVLSAASPAVSGGTVVVPFASGEVVALDTAKGELKWADAVVRASRTRAISGLSQVAASPVVSDGTVYATGVSGRTIAIRLTDGERLWESNIGSASTPAVSGGALFLIDIDDNMVALDRKTGAVIWRTALPVVRKKKFHSTWVGPTLAGGALWAASSDGRLIKVDPAGGKVVGSQALTSPAYLKPVAAGGRLYVLTNDGSVAALN